MILILDIANILIVRFRLPATNIYAKTPPAQAGLIRTPVLAPANARAEQILAI